MVIVRDGLLGNFVTLYRAVRAIAACIDVSDLDVDGRRGLNGGGSGDFESMLERTVIRGVVGEAKAAAVLFRHLSAPSSWRPRWQHSAVGGFPIADDAVGMEGLQILAQWGSADVSFQLQQRSGRAKRNESAVLSGDAPPALRMNLIGFDIDDLVHFLDANGVAHSLGAPLNPPVELVKEGPYRGVVAPATLLTADAKTSTPPTVAFSGRHNDFRRPGKQCTIRREILAAMAQCSEPVRHREVMARLLDVARAGHALLKVKDNLLHYVGTDGKLMPYTSDALRQFVRAQRRREAASDKRRLGEQGKGRC